MIRAFMIAAASAAVLTLSLTAFAQQPGQSGAADEMGVVAVAVPAQELVVGIEELFRLGRSRSEEDCAQKKSGTSARK